MFFLLFGFWVLLNGSWNCADWAGCLGGAVRVHRQIHGLLAKEGMGDCAPSAAHHRVLSVSGEGGFPLGVGDDQARVVAEARC